MHTAMRYWWLVLMLWMVGCGGGGGGESDSVDTGDGVLGDGVGFDVVESTNSIPLPEFTLQVFNVVLEADRTMVGVDTPVTVAVRFGRGSAEGLVNYTWGFEGGTSQSDAGAATQVITFAEAGSHLISVTATDAAGNSSEAGVLVTVLATTTPYVVGDVDGNGLVAAEDETALQAALELPQELTAEAIDLADIDLDGRLTSFDLELVSNAVAAQAQAPRMMWPAEGYVGVKIRLIHPALLNPNVEVHLAVGESTVVPVRAKPGYATFVLPPNLEEGDLSLKLMVDGVEEDSFAFANKGLAKASSEPGKKVLEALTLANQALETLPDAYSAYFEELAVDADQRAAIQGMLQVAIESFATHSEAFAQVFAQMEVEGKAAFEQVALANGLDDAIAQLQALAPVTAKMDKADGLTVNQAANILAVICAAKNIADIAAKIAEINDIAAGYLSWFDWFPVNKLPIVGQVITFLSGLSTAIGAITDIIDIASKFVPDLGDMVITAAPTTLQVGISGTLSLAVTIKILSKLCGEAANALISSIMDAMNEKLTKRIGSCIPLVSTAFKAAKYDREKMGSIVGKIYDCVSAIAGKILDALGIEGLLQNLAQSVCNLLKDPKLPLDPQLIKPSCGTNAGGTWTCVEECAGAVGLKAETEICGDEKKAESSLECQGCDANSCAAGCCDTQECVPFGGQSDAKCGAAGAKCAACADKFKCTQGVCICTSDCLVEGEKECAGNKIRMCKPVPGSNPKCLKWYAVQDCINGAVCEGGICLGGCNGENCTGCCLSDGTCKGGDSTDACGKDGATCMYCSGGFDQCVNGVCVCQPQCAGKQCGPDQCGGECGQCPVGSTCDANGTCASNCGNGVVNAGEECEKDADCADAKVCKNCKCETGGGGGQCKCGDAGVVLQPDPCDWPDASQCSGWASLYCFGECGGWDSMACWDNCENEWSEVLFDSGAQLCADGCCVTITCP